MGLKELSLRWVIMSRAGKMGVGDWGVACGGKREGAGALAASPDRRQISALPPA